MGLDKLPPSVSLGGHPCEVIQFYSGRAQIVCTAPRMSGEMTESNTWMDMVLTTAAGEVAACDTQHSCRVRFRDNLAPKIKTILNPQLDGTEALAVEADNGLLRTYGSDEMVFKLGSMRCVTYGAEQESVTEQMNSVEEDFITANHGRRRGTGQVESTSHACILLDC